MHPNLLSPPCIADGRQLLQDIEYVVNTANQHTISSPHTHSLWESHEGTVSKLQCLLPNPLSGEDLSNLLPPDSQGQSQSLLALLYDQLCRHNTALISIHASLQTLLGYIKGGGLFSTKIGTTLTSIMYNVFPVGWHVPKGEPNHGAADNPSWYCCTGITKHFQLVNICYGHIHIDSVITWQE